MKRSVGAALLTLMITACGGSASSSPPASAPTSAPVPTQAATTAAPPVSTLPGASPVAASPSSAVRGTFTLCFAPTDADTCPLAPGRYTAKIHDGYALTITDPGWQEERSATSGEVEGTVILSRTDAPVGRLSIDTGETSVILEPSDLAALLAGSATFQMNAPIETQVGGAAGFQVDLAPTEVRQVRVPGAGTYTFMPGHRYRLIVLQLPMGEESGIKAIIIDSPTASFDAFAKRAGAVLQTLGFSNPT